MGNFSYRIGPYTGLPVREFLTKDFFAAGREDVPKVCYHLYELEDYTKDFVNDIDADLSVTLNVQNKCISMKLYFWTENGSVEKNGKFLWFDIPYKSLEKMEVPDIGNLLFQMWNAYVMAFVDDDKPTRPWPYDGEYIIPEEEADVNVLFRSMPWVVPEEEEDAA